MANTLSPFQNYGCFVIDVLFMLLKQELPGPNEIQNSSALIEFKERIKILIITTRHYSLSSITTQ